MPHASCIMHSVFFGFRCVFCLAVAPHWAKECLKDFVANSLLPFSHKKQVMMYSATMPKEVRETAKRFMQNVCHPLSICKNYNCMFLISLWKFTWILSPSLHFMAYSSITLKLLTMEKIEN